MSEREKLDPTTGNNRKLGLRIGSQAFLLIELDLKVDGSIIILPSSLVCFRLYKDVKSSVMSRYCKGGIFPP